MRNHDDDFDNNEYRPAVPERSEPPRAYPMDHPATAGQRPAWGLSPSSRSENMFPPELQSSVPPELRLPNDPEEATTTTSTPFTAVLARAPIMLERPINTEEVPIAVAVDSKKSSQVYMVCLALVILIIGLAVLAVGLKFGLAKPDATSRVSSIQDEATLTTTEAPTLAPPMTTPIPTNSPTTTNTPTVSPTTRGYQAILEILQHVSSESDLSNASSPQFQALEWLASNASSPQFQALEWLANTDSFSSKSLKDGATTEDRNTIVERYIMALLYYATDGPNWKEQHQFLSGSSVCGWNNKTSGRGVVCFESNVVNLIYLYENNLKGSIPSEINLLSNLLDIFLFDNQLSGSIPNMSNLSLLEKLEMDGNLLTGTLRTELFTLTNLQTLVFRDNQNLSGSLPTSLQNLTNLRQLSFGGCSLMGTIPEEAMECISSTLEILEIYDNEMTGTLPTELGYLTNLEFLQLGGNQFRGSLPSQLGRLVRHLSEFDVSRNDLTGSVPSTFRNLSSTIVYLDGNNITGDLGPIFCPLISTQQELSADCSEKVECDCCTFCCDDSGCTENLHP